jgi:putative endonuclease
MPNWFGRLFKRETPKDALGGRGENVAARYLRNKGFKIILRNFRCDLGEIDIIAREGTTLVFVEVKTRSYDDPTPEDQVNEVKQGQVARAAKFYLGRYGVPQPPSRFDVVAVVWPNNHEPIIRHTTHAFEA